MKSQADKNFFSTDIINNVKIEIIDFERFSPSTALSSALTQFQFSFQFVFLCPFICYHLKRFNRNNVPVEKIRQIQNVQNKEIKKIDEIFHLYVLIRNKCTLKIRRKPIFE